MYSTFLKQCITYIYIQQLCCTFRTTFRLSSFLQFSPVGGSYLAVGVQGGICLWQFVRDPLSLGVAYPTPPLTGSASAIDHYTYMPVRLGVGAGGVRETPWLCTIPTVPPSMDATTRCRRLIDGLWSGTRRSAPVTAQATVAVAAPAGRAPDSEPPMVVGHPFVAPQDRITVNAVTGLPTPPLLGTRTTGTGLVGPLDTTHFQPAVAQHVAFSPLGRVMTTFLANSRSFLIIDIAEALRVGSQPLRSAWPAAPAAPAAPVPAPENEDGANRCWRLTTSPCTAVASWFDAGLAWLSGSAVALTPPRAGLTWMSLPGGGDNEPLSIMQWSPSGKWSPFQLNRLCSCCYSLVLYSFCCFQGPSYSARRANFCIYIVLWIGL
jgi:hypothetical protein